MTDQWRAAGHTTLWWMEANGKMRKCQIKKSPSLICKRKNCPEIPHDWVSPLWGRALASDPEDPMLASCKGPNPLRQATRQMTRRSSVCQQRRSHFPGQAAWSHFSGQVAWYINPLCQAKRQMTRRSSVGQQRRSLFPRPGGMVHHPTSQAKRHVISTAPNTPPLKPSGMAPHAQWTWMGSLRSRRGGPHLGASSSKQPHN